MKKDLGHRHLAELVRAVNDSAERARLETALSQAQQDLIEATLDGAWFVLEHKIGKAATPRPPINAEYVLHLLLREEEREGVIGDLIEGYGKIRQRFNKRRADIWFYKEVAGSLWPLLRRAIVKIGAFVWFGRMLRRFIS